MLAAATLNISIVAVNPRDSTWPRPALAAVRGLPLAGLPTSGGAQVVVDGIDLGRIGENLTLQATCAAGGASTAACAVASSTPVWAGACNATPNAALDPPACARQTTLVCTTGEGWGVDCAWSAVVADGVASGASRFNTSHAPPVVGRVSSAPPAGAAAALVELVENATAQACGLTAGATSACTDGGEDIYVYGVNFGPVGGPPASLWRSALAAGDPWVAGGANCTIAVAHSVLRCTAAPGVGANASWGVTAAGQRSPDARSSFARPRLTSVVTPATLTTAGGVSVVLSQYSTDDDLPPPHPLLLKHTNTHAHTNTQTHARASTHRHTRKRFLANTVSPCLVHS